MKTDLEYSKMFRKVTTYFEYNIVIGRFQTNKVIIYYSFISIFIRVSHFLNLFNCFIN